MSGLHLPRGVEASGIPAEGRARKEQRGGISRPGRSRPSDAGCWGARRGPPFMRRQAHTAVPSRPPEGPVGSFSCAHEARGGAEHVLARQSRLFSPLPGAVGGMCFCALAVQRVPSGSATVALVHRRNGDKGVGVIRGRVCGKAVAATAASVCSALWGLWGSPGGGVTATPSLDTTRVRRCLMASGPPAGCCRGSEGERVWPGQMGRRLQGLGRRQVEGGSSLTRME